MERYGNASPHVGQGFLMDRCRAICRVGYHNHADSGCL